MAAGEAAWGRTRRERRQLCDALRVGAKANLATFCGLGPVRERTEGGAWHVVDGAVGRSCGGGSSEQGSGARATREHRASARSVAWDGSTGVSAGRWRPLTANALVVLALTGSRAGVVRRSIRVPDAWWLQWSAQRFARRGAGRVAWGLFLPMANRPMREAARRARASPLTPPASRAVGGSRPLPGLVSPLHSRRRGARCSVVPHRIGADGCRKGMASKRRA